MAVDVGQEIRHARLFMERFINRTDVYALQYEGESQHGYRTVRGRLGLSVVLAHLWVRLTLGVYALSAESTAKWLVIDVDTMVASALEGVLENAEKLGLPRPIVEFSGSKGYHFWWFFKVPVAGWQARKLGLLVTKEHEVFPKQARVSSDTSRPGSLVKAPLGIHRVSGQRSVFVDEHFETITDPWPILEAVETVGIENLMPLLDTGRNRPHRSAWSLSSVKQLRPWVEKAIRDGSRQGQRNEVGHLIACEMRRLGMPKKEAGVVLACWNLRNQPGVNRGELHLILEGGYAHEEYRYGCSPDGHLRKLLECVGEERCPCFRHGGSSEPLRRSE